MEIASIVLAGIAAAAAVIVLGFAYVSHCARKRNELPKIQMYEYQNSKETYSFHLETDQHSSGWEVERVEVIDADIGLQCLSQDLQRITNDGQTESLLTYQSNWREFCDFPERLPGIPQVLYIHPDCIKASLSFICTVPSRFRWKKRGRKRVFYRFVKGTHAPFTHDPNAAYFLRRVAPDLTASGYSGMN